MSYAAQVCVFRTFVRDGGVVRTGTKCRCCRVGFGGMSYIDFHVVYMRIWVVLVVVVLFISNSVLVL